MRQTLKIAAVSSLLGAITGSLTTWMIITIQKPVIETSNDLIRNFYNTETAVYISPHTLRKRMDKNETNFILVDVRSSQEYEKEHIVSAINIPAYRDPNISISLDNESDEKTRIIESFKKLPVNTEIIVYCYSMPCMTGRKIGKLMAENDIYVKHLGVGWNEWRYFWDLWNHDGETPSDNMDYVVSGAESGKPKIKDNFSPCVQGELGC